jgi:hypothetical protein
VIVVQLALLGLAVGVVMLCFWIIHYIILGGVRDELKFPLDGFEEAAEKC